VLDADIRGFFDTSTTGGGHQPLTGGIHRSERGDLASHAVNQIPFSCLIITDRIVRSTPFLGLGDEPPGPAHDPARGLQPRAGRRADNLTR